MYGQVSIMERRLFYTEGTEEFRKSLDDLPQREQILRELEEVAEKWERDGYLPEDFVADSVCLYKFFIRRVSYRLFLKVCTLSQDNIEHRVRDCRAFQLLRLRCAEHQRFS